MSWFRIGFALAGFLAALLSVALNDDRIAWLAIALLTVSLILRLILRKGGNGPPKADGPV
jgi:hypothetical protein